MQLTRQIVVRVKERRDPRRSLAPPLANRSTKAEFLETTRRRVSPLTRTFFTAGCSLKNCPGRSVHDSPRRKQDGHSIPKFSLPFSLHLVQRDRGPMQLLELVAHLWLPIRFRLVVEVGPVRETKGLALLTGPALVPRLGVQFRVTRHARERVVISALGLGPDLRKFSRKLNFHENFAQHRVERTEFSTTLSTACLS